MTHHLHIAMFVNAIETPFAFRESMFLCVKKKWFNIFF